MPIVPKLPVLTDDAQLARRLDLWGAYHRVLAAGVGIVLALVVLPTQAWVAELLTAYLGIALTLPAVLSRGSLGLISIARPVWMLADILVVGTLTHVWGARISPAPFLFVPVVVAWTLVPQRGVGPASLALSLVVVAATLLGEARSRVPPASDDVVSGPALFFILFAGALGSAHVVVAFTVRRMTAHVRELSQLREEAAQKKREADMALALEEGQRLEALGRLAGGIAHDFNNSLTALLGFAEVARLELDRRPQRARDALKQIEVAAQSAANLTRHLLDFASRRPTHPKPVDLRLEVTRCADLIARVLGGETKLTLELGEEPCIAHIDPGGIERILLNLAVNARDAMPEGGVLSIGVHRDEAVDTKRVELRVGDTGQGIDPVSLPRIFEPFFTTKGLGKGTGLGLSSVYGLARKAGGEVLVESVVGVGTTFRIFLPLTEARVEPAHLASASREQSVLTVLIVDDDDGVRSVAKSYLSQAGYTVMEAHDGAEALKAFAERGHLVALVLTDVRMPGMTGVELMVELRKRAPHLPIVIVSAFPDSAFDGGDGLPVGATFLAKPYSSQTLIDAVQTALHAAR